MEAEARLPLNIDLQNIEVSTPEPEDTIQADVNIYDFKLGHLVSIGVISN